VEEEEVCLKEEDEEDCMDVEDFWMNVVLEEEENEDENPAAGT
jgi:hypothetical protein